MHISNIGQRQCRQSHIQKIPFPKTQRKTPDPSQSRLVFPLVHRPTRKIMFEKIGQNLHSICSARMDRDGRLRPRKLPGRLERDLFYIFFGCFAIGIVRSGCSGGNDIDKTPLFAIALTLVPSLGTSFADRLSLVALFQPECQFSFFIKFQTKTNEKEQSIRTLIFRRRQVRHGRNTLDLGFAAAVVSLSPVICLTLMPRGGALG